LQGSTTITLTEGNNYIEPGFSAVDNTDGAVEVNVSGTVNTNKPGTYILTYTATDAAGNTSSKSRTVIVTEKDNGINNGTKNDTGKVGGIGILLLPLMLIGIRKYKTSLK